MKINKKDSGDLNKKNTGLVCERAQGEIINSPCRTE